MFILRITDALTPADNRATCAALPKFAWESRSPQWRYHLSDAFYIESLFDASTINLFKLYFERLILQLIISLNLKFEILQFRCRRITFCSMLLFKKWNENESERFKNFFFANVTIIKFQVREIDWFSTEEWIARSIIEINWL
jgi:hypothetical protein